MQFFVYHNYQQELSRESVQHELQRLPAPSKCTECGCNSADFMRAKSATSRGYMGWHYQAYCNTRDDSVAPKDFFGACITGYASANVSCVAAFP